ncbi:phosphotransferase [Nocardioides sp. cx-173]|nr:phosphotransferase [Nocardioides sp. cx-173]MCD4526275.1 phosphotransferase [Nocardioides sp. cx-173]UGB40516.1 phosphotransferase [Nocardioides sp. cx-173]
MADVIPSPIPHGRTARRLEWAHLPPHARALVERRCGSPVVDARSQGAGFTPGFASVLTCEDGSRHFVKAASAKAQRMFAHSYREEARKLAALPPATPAPRLLWVHDADDWVVLGLEHVEARNPRRPWRATDLQAAVAMLARTAEVLTPAPGPLSHERFEVEFAEFPGFWDHVRTTRPDLPHLEEAAALAARFAEVTAGDTLVHTDVRDDNILVGPDGSAVLCDWNWPVVGAAWLDTVFLMIGPRGDGLDVDAALAAAPLTAEVPAEHVDIVLALLAAYFLRQGDEPVPPSSPYLREAQRWQGEVVWEWLCERRGW